MNPDVLTVLTALGLYAAVVISPGPNFALISKLAMSGARSTAVGATFGFAIAATFYAVLTMAGLALVLARVGWLASLIQIAGGYYLVYLGLMAWLSSKPDTMKQGVSSVEKGSVLRGLRMGMIVNLSNPKGIAFFIGLYAVAVPPETGLLAKLAILVGGFMIEIIWYSLVTALLSRRQAKAVYDRFGQWVERAIGTALAGFGIRLIAEKI
ncbi:threonine transporter [Agrobacterium vitis]|uniref:LysE family translocator n=1 Tax=Rhizobium/Agrobacterium group TaxID=227290 RepID=UPI0008DC0B4D|nr:MULTISPECIES: LysE family transporter [Rhizobium/Agrobacterium group]MCF1435709.1 threonine transporter [Allorhizobium ampelinum]MUO90307.1 threonine transporter [Agrobacterium vitis]MUZ52318.1 threonine transporter [Agrobacterium vitis]MUZ91632.1 threonine transporter [Agrobacterium vitis]MVA39720.1 threonine transporter [Agrobacterium vitis]